MYLGLDLGTGSLKAALIGADSVSRWVGDERYDARMVGDRAEIDVELWWEACKRVLARAPKELVGRVEAIGVSGQMHGVILVNEQNEAVHDAILWPDRRAVAEAAEFGALERARPGSLGNPVVPGMPGPVLMWVRSHEPEVWSAARQVLSPKDWLRSRLTGEAPVVTDASDASATLMYDVSADAWSATVLEHLGLDRTAVPEIVSSDAVAGHVSARASCELGIAEGVPVAVGAADSAAAILGLGVGVPGSVVLNVGTAAQVLSIVDRTGDGFLDRQLHQYRTAGGDSSWYVMASVLNAGLTLSWVRRVLGLDWDGMYRHADAALQSRDADPLFVPFLVGERDPDVGLEAHAAWSRLGPEHGRDALVRAALLGVAAYLARRTRMMLELTAGQRVTLSGGSSRNPGWAQLLATLIGCEVDLATEGHASARGAAMTAARATGADLAPGPISGHVRPQPALAEAARATLRVLGETIADV